MEQPIKGFEGYHTICPTGKVYNKKGVELKGRANNSGYLLISLYKKGYRKANTIHRLVALHFIPNPDNLPQVNHKDGDKLNNHVYNLEWVTNSENSKHFFKYGNSENARKVRSENLRKTATDPVIREKIRQTLLKKHFAAKRVKQIDLDGNVVAVYNSGRQARAKGFNNISKVLTGKQDTAGGYKWEYDS